MFSGFLRKQGINPNDFPYYEHEYLDGRRPTVRARLYPIDLLPDFIRFFNEVWLPRQAKRYFREKYPKALPFLDRIRKLPGA